MTEFARVEIKGGTLSLFLNGKLACDFEVRQDGIPAWGFESATEEINSAFALAVKAAVEKEREYIAQKIESMELYLTRGPRVLAADIRALPAAPTEERP